jgi:hypothetical protein
VYTQVGSRLISVYPGHYVAAGDVIREAGLIVSTLNVIEDPAQFRPVRAGRWPGRTVEHLAAHLTNALGMGAPGILIWDGRLHDDDQLDGAPKVLAECIGKARKLPVRGRIACRSRQSSIRSRSPSSTASSPSWLKCCPL